MNTAGIAFVAFLYGLAGGALSTLCWKLRNEAQSESEPLEYKPVVGHHALLHKSLLEPTEFPQGSNFDYLCEWPIEDTRLDWTEEWMQRMNRG